MPTIKECPPGKVLNPKTNRCVKADGKIGKQLAQTHQKPATIPDDVLRIIGQKATPKTKRVLMKTTKVFNEDLKKRDGMPFLKVCLEEMRKEPNEKEKILEIFTKDTVLLISYHGDFVKVTTHTRHLNWNEDKVSNTQKYYDYEQISVLNEKTKRIVSKKLDLVLNMIVSIIDKKDLNEILWDAYEVRRFTDNQRVHTSGTKAWKEAIKGNERRHKDPKKL